MTMDQLKQIDKLHWREFESCPAAVHDDHRWSLAMIAYAQQQGFVPTPCRLVTFDAHSYSLKPRCMDEIKQLRANMLNTEKC